MAVSPFWGHPDQRHRARGIACVALVALLLASVLLGMAAIDASPVTFKGREFDEDRFAANALGWPLPGEARPPPATQAQTPRASPRLLASVILLRMVPVGWMAPPGVRPGRHEQAQTIG